MFNFDDRRGNENDRKLILDPSTGAIVFNSHRETMTMATITTMIVTENIAY